MSCPVSCQATERPPVRGDDRAALKVVDCSPFAKSIRLCFRSRRGVGAVATGHDSPPSLRRGVNMKRSNSTIVGAVLGALAVCAFTVVAQSADPWVGTWKVNLDKSTYSPGPKPTTAAVVRMDSAQGGVKVTIDGADPQGKPTHVELNGKFDGKDAPAPAAPTPNSTDAFKRMDARSFEIVAKTDGKPTVATR